MKSKPMPLMFRRCALIVAIMEIAFCLCGCMGYRHDRDFVTTHPDGRVDTRKESTSLRTLFKKGEASVVGSTVQDGDYSRTVGVQGFKATGDSQSIKVVSDASVKHLKPDWSNTPPFIDNAPGPSDFTVPFILDTKNLPADHPFRAK